MKRQLLIFAKYPEPGRVKTRLARRVGSKRAAQLYKEMVEEVVRRTAPVDGEFERLLVFDPPEREQAFRTWLPSLTYFAPQFGRNLGERMKHAFEQSLTAENRVVLVGSDCIEIDQVLIEQAFDKLDNCDLVLGPAQDGGYYLIGCKKLYAELFEQISWSTDRVMMETLQKVKRLNLTVEQLPVLSDIDT